MDRDAVLERLRAHEAELKAMGLARVSLFGSVARGEAGPESDVVSRPSSIRRRRSEC